MSVATCTRPLVDPAVRERRMGVIFQANAAPLRQYLVRLTRGQYEAAEDLLQETMLRAWRKMDDLPDDDVLVRRWLFTVARNLSIDAIRAKKARPAEVYGDLGVCTAPVEDDVDRLLDRQVLRDALLRLTDQQRAVLVALYCRDASVADTAVGLGIPEGTVRSRSFYALRTVREMLSRQRALGAVQQP
ncbi:sigma-70 family RNA polymerase sigma factor [Micromonospora sp. NPDC050795]|uniref:sigma-70 family RNA polymerase sigma factor n=1 Tax=Micromonospora sp. NPDC050795 TaxID=3364282 RepID=UPI0037A8D3AB